MLLNQSLLPSMDLVLFVCYIVRLYVWGEVLYLYVCGFMDEKNSFRRVAFIVLIGNDVFR
jgi:hypothetical protein